MDQENPSFGPLEALTIKQAAELLHVSEPTVRAYIKRGELASMLIGRCRRIRRIDLEDFENRRTAYGWQTHRKELPQEDSEPHGVQGDNIPF